MTGKKTIRLFWWVVLIVPLLAWGLMNIYEKKVKALPVLGSAVMDFRLVNQHGQVRGLNDWKNKIVVAYFFFTRCPVVCPEMTINLKTVSDAYLGQSSVQICAFTIDPVHDDREKLMQFSRRFGLPTSRWDLLTGDKPGIYKLARNSFKIVATEGDGGPDDFIHSDNVVLLDQQQRIRGYYEGTNGEDVAQLITDIKKLQNE